MSVVVYAGSMQFALVPLLAAATPLPTIAVMTLMVNSRHLFYGLSFVEMFREMGRKAPYMVFALTDETYSVLCACRGDAEMARDHHVAAFYIAALQHGYWVLGSLLGAVAGQLLAFDTTGIDFAMTALFTVILTDQVRSGGRAVMRCAAVGAALALAFLLALGADAFLLPTLAAWSSRWRSSTTSERRLPAMPDGLYIFSAIAVCALCTLALRAAPFILFRGGRRLPPAVRPPRRQPPRRDHRRARRLLPQIAPYLPTPRCRRNPSSPSPPSLSSTSGSAIPSSASRRHRAIHAATAALG